MVEINRSVLVVKPKQPFLDWVHSLDDESKGITSPTVREDCSAYLVPEIREYSDQSLVLEWCYDLLFEEQLDGWHTDPKDWPQDRNLKMFLEWFDVEFHSLVFDLCDDPIQVINYESDDTTEETIDSN
jgi:hypothetical protein